MKTIIIRILILAAYTIAPFSLAATTYTWNGIIGNWSDPTKWTPNGVPGNLDSVNIADGRVNLDMQDTVTYVQFTGDTLLGNANLVILGDFIWNAGVIMGAGMVEIMGKLKCTTGPVTIHDKILKMQGGGNWTNTTFTMHGASEFFISAGDTLLIDVTAGLREMKGPSGKMTNQGTVIKTGVNAFLMDTPAFINTGNLVINGGTMTNGWNGATSSHNGATITIAINCVFRHEGGSSSFANSIINGAGTFQLSRPGAVYHFNGGNSVSVTTFTLSQAVLNLNQDIDFVNVILAGGGSAALNTTHNHTVSGNLTWSSCHINGTGTITVNGNLTCSNATNTITNKTISFDGTGTWSRSNFTMHGSSKIIIPSGKTLTITADNANKGIFGSGGTLENNGTIIKTGGYYFANDIAALNNYGTININQGTLYVGYLGSTNTYNGGTINVSGTFAPNGGTHTFTNTTISGSGTFLTENGSIACQVHINTGVVITTAYTIITNNSTVNLNIPITFNSLNIQNNASINGNSAITVTNALLWNTGTVSGTDTLQVNGPFNSSTANNTLVSKTIVLSGGGYWYRSNFIINGDGKFLLPSGQSFIFYADDGIYGVTGSGGTFENHGTLLKQGSNNFEGNSLRLINYGDILIDEGILKIGYSGSNSAFYGDSLFINANTSFILNGGIHDFESITISGEGTFILENGQLPCTANMSEGTEFSSDNIIVRNGASAYLFESMSVNGITLTGGGKLITQDTLFIIESLHLDFGSFNGSGVINVIGDFLATASSNSIYGTLILHGSGIIDNGSLSVTGIGKLIIPTGDSLVIVDSDNSIIGGSGTLEVNGEIIANFPGMLSITCNMNLQGNLYSMGDILLGALSNRVYNFNGATMVCSQDVFVIGGIVNIENSNITVEDTFDVKESVLHLNSGNTIDSIHFYLHDEGVMHVNDVTNISNISIIDTTFSFTYLYIHDSLFITGDLITNYAFIYVIADLSVEGQTNLSNTNFEGSGTLHSYGGYNTAAIDYVHFAETTWKLHSNGTLRRLSLQNNAKIINLAGKIVVIGETGDNGLYDYQSSGGSFDNYGIVEKIGPTTYTIQCPFFNHPAGEILIQQGNIVFE